MVSMEATGVYHFALGNKILLNRFKAAQSEIPGFGKQ